MIIYCIENKINGKKYIGQTRYTLKQRLYRHRQKVKVHSNLKLYQAINKYGWDNFNCYVLCECDSIDELNKKETYYINLYDTYKHGYNMTLGGDSNLMFVEEYRQKHDKKMQSNEVRNKISNSMQKFRKAQGFSEQTRNKISEKLKGNDNWKHRKLPTGVSVKCFDANKTFEKIFKNRTEAVAWWFEHGNTSGQTRRFRDIQESIISKKEVKGLFWCLEEK